MGVIGSRKRVIAAGATVAAAVAIALVYSGRGCRKDDNSPEGAVRAFITAARSGDKRAAWELLGPKTQDRYRYAAQTAGEKAGGPQRYSPSDMLEVTRIEPVRVSFSVRKKSGDGHRAVVEVEGPDGRTDELEVVKVGKRWRVELPFEGDKKEEEAVRTE